MLTVALILAAVAAFSLVVWAIINRQKIIDWFRNKRPIRNPQEVAFTLKSKIANGDYEVIQGFFNQQTATFSEDTQVIQSSQMDPAMMRGKQLELYN